MSLFDFAVIVGKNKEIQKLIWQNTLLEEKYQYSSKLKIGCRLEQLLAKGYSDKKGTCFLERDLYLYESCQLSSSETAFFFFHENKKELLLEKALDVFPKGIQIYDKNGYLLYCNRKSREISTIPDSMEVIGKHMLDIWNVKEERSTVLCCLKTKAPVKNIVDTFPSVTAGEVTTVNTANPLFEDGKIAGAILFERDLSVIQKQREELQVLQKALESYTESNPLTELSGYTFEKIVGNSPSFLSAVELAQKFAPLDCNILLIGETGTGKEMFAQSIHRRSTRSHRNFVAVNCAALPDTLIESMLFGTTKGAFTGSENKKGLFEEANGGTLFLDELNSMSLAMQSKILRVVQEGYYRKIGGSQDIKTDVRILSSCNEDPFALVEGNTMRRDLFYRLSSVQIRIPSLRERLDDLDLLIDRYITLKKYRFAKAIQGIHPEVMELFRNYNWPGNVRELFHVLDYAMNVMEDGVIVLSCLPAYLTEQVVAKKAAHYLETEQDIYHTKLEHLIGDYEAEILRKVLSHYGNNISRAAESLGICRQTLSYRLHKYGIIV